MSWTFEATKAGYGNLWRTIKVKAGQDDANATKWARKIIENEARYRDVTAQTGAPWFFIGALHMRESGCDFNGILHNGEHIIGKGTLTKLVPKGRGPFNSWKSAAVDALRLKNFHKINEWSIERMLFESERFNGFGYVNKGINSPYVWASSNHEQSGKYVADGVFDRNANDSQMGVATVIKRICEIRPDVASIVNSGYVPPPPDVDRPTKPTKPQPAEHWLIRLIKFLFWRRG